MRQLDTPFKRACLIVMATGVIGLAVSLLVWTFQSRYHRIYYTEEHYGWVEGDRPTAVRKEKVWSSSAKCVAPFLRRDVEAAEQALNEHLRKEPPVPSLSSPNFQKRLGWETTRSSLSFDVSRAKNLLANNLSKTIRADQVRESVRYSGVDLSHALGYPSAAKRDTRTDEQKFNDALYGALGIGSLQQDARNKAFQDCVTPSISSYVLLKTTHHSDIDNWPRDHSIPFSLALALFVGGFLGSVGFGFSNTIWNLTGKRAVSWVQTGRSTASLARPSSPELETANPRELQARTANVTLDPGAKAHFLPHLIFLGAPIALLILAFLSDSGPLGVFFGRIAGSITDPLLLLPALIVGATIRRHGVVVVALTSLAVFVSIVVAQMNADFGARLSLPIVFARIVASLFAGYVANLIRTLLDHRSEPPTTN